MKRRIRLTESDLHRIIKESVNKVLKETVTTSYGKISKERDDYEEGDGYFRDDYDDYWDNWVPAPRYDEKFYNTIPKSARFIAQTCEKYIEKNFKDLIEDINSVYNINIVDFKGNLDTNLYMKNEDLLIYINWNECYYIDKDGRKWPGLLRDIFICDPKLSSEEKQKISKIFSKRCELLEKRLKNFGEVNLNSSNILGMAIFINNFVDKNGNENVEHGYSKPDTRSHYW